MGLIDEKQDIFTQIGALTSIAGEVDLPDPTNSLSSINNTNEIVPFLLDMLTVLVGSESLKTTVGEVMTEYIDSVEPTLKSSLKEQFTTFNSDLPLPSGFTGNGYTFNMGQIDLSEKLKNDPNSQVGSLLYNNNVNDFDNKLYEAILLPGVAITFNVISLTYDDIGDTVTVKPINPSQTIGDFTNDYIDGLNIIDKKGFISKFIDLLFGTITSNENKTLDKVIEEEKTALTIQKIIDEEEDITISDDELKQIEQLSEDKLSGIEYYDVGCGLIPNNITLDNLQGLISGTTGSSDPLTVGDAYVDTLLEGFTDGNPSGSTAVSDTANENAQAIKDGFFKRLINAIVNILVESVTSPPQIRALLGLFTGFKNNDIPQLGNPIDDIQNNRNLIDCLSKSARNTINEFLFNLVKKELIKLIVPISKIILKEKINQYLGIIQSLVRLI
jgi:hypothetical protein